jgi:hypothetical protein
MTANSNAAPVISKASIDVSAPAPFVTSAATDARRQYHFPSLGCNTCHADPHGIDPQANLSCATCHASERWTSLRPFDHSLARFKLEGPHKEAATRSCIQCHKPSMQSDDATAGTVPVFSSASTQCSGCHIEKDAHGGQFSAPGKGQKDCSSCHIPAAWNAGGFKHDKSGFALTGVHRQLPCAQCHKDQKQVNGKIVRVYRDTPNDCLKCHN